jgi:hypothetical protein
MAIYVSIYGLPRSDLGSRYSDLAYNLYVEAYYDTGVV